MRATLITTVLASISAELVHVPGGHVVESDCILEVSNGVRVDLDATPAACTAMLAAPKVQIYASDVHMQSDEPLTSFTADWVVPPLPRVNRGQVVYFWPGFKSQQPEMGLPVLQPVLQYGQSSIPFIGKGKWQLQSWFVDGNDSKFPVVTAPAITVSPGDKITSFMSQSDDGTTWTVSGTDLTTGQDSTLQVSYTKAGSTDYDYAMLVNENIDVNSNCQRMPDDTDLPGVLTFTNVTVNGKAPQWTQRANCAGNPKCDCANDVEVSDKGDVSLKWSTQSATIV